MIGALDVCRLIVWTHFESKFNCLSTPSLDFCREFGRLDVCRCMCLDVRTFVGTFYVQTLVCSADQGRGGRAGARGIPYIYMDGLKSLCCGLIFGFLLNPLDNHALTL